MKKRIALLMALTLTATGLFACGKDTDKKETSNAPAVESEDNQEQESTAKDSTSAPTYAITSVAAEGYDYFTGSIQCIQITDSEHPELAKAIDDYFSGRVENFNSGIENSNKEAQEFNEENKKYAEEEGYDYETIRYEDTVSVQVARADAEVFSFVICEYYYTGGAHGGAFYEGVSFDSKTGKEITLKDCGDLTAIAATSKDYILTSIEQSDENAKSQLFDDDVTSYKTTIDEQFATEILPAYYLDNVGVTFMFQQYDIAPYAAGKISFTVPYSMFDQFNSAYIPADGFYTFGLSDVGFISRADVDGDGGLDVLSLSNNYYGETEETPAYTLTVGDDSIKLPMEDYQYLYASYVHTLDGNYIIITNEGTSITLYSVSNGIKQVGELETALTLKEIKDGEIVVGECEYTEQGQKWLGEETHKYSKSGIQ